MQVSARACRTALGFVALSLLSTPALLWAHARLLRSVPSANARLDQAPTSLSLWFSENPELRFTTLRLLDSAGVAIRLGAVDHPRGDASGVTAAITQPLAAGRYTIVWRTAAADGHATSDRFSFVLTRSSTPAASAPAASPSGDTATIPPAQSTLPKAAAEANELFGPRALGERATAAARWAELVAILTVIGAITFRGYVLPRTGWPAERVSDATDRSRRLARAALVLVVLCFATRLAAAASLMPDARMLDRRAMMDVATGTQWGHGWLVGVAGIVVALIGLSIPAKATAGWLVAAIGALALALSAPLTGHAIASAHYRWTAVTSDFIHLAAAGAWVGGLVAVVLAGLPALRRASEADRASGGRRLVRTYHGVATVGVAVVLLTGFVNAWLRLGVVSDLWTTAYGQVLVVKLLLFVGLAWFGYRHWRTVVDTDWIDSSAARFRRTASMELGVGVLVLAATAVLLSASTPADSRGASNTVMTHASTASSPTHHAP